MRVLLQCGACCRPGMGVTNKSQLRAGSGEGGSPQGLKYQNHVVPVGMYNRPTLHAWLP